MLTVGSTSKRRRGDELNGALDSQDKRVKQTVEEAGAGKEELHENAAVAVSKVESKSKTPRLCPYLGTINRHVLDFDFEKLCSVSLTNLRPYGCLVCGKYFQGRGKGTHAMTHALEAQHYIFINLHDTKVYCLPENYEVVDASLNDIKYHLNPTYTEEEVRLMSSVARYGKALDGTDYIPGCIGLNNLKQTDYFNVVIQLLCNVIPLRNFLLLMDLSHQQSPDPVSLRLGELVRKIHNPNNFKGIVSPHEFLQAVGVASQKRFRIGQQQDPLALLSWLLQRLQKLKRPGTGESLIRYCFEGQLLVSTSSLIPGTTDETPPEERVTPSLFVMLKVPPAPIFRDGLERNTIPQLPIFDLLQKFDGVTPLETTPGKLTRYSIWKLPAYLIVHINRFSKNNFFLEKNPTVVTFPVKNFDLRDYVHPLAREENPVTRYDLVLNIFHEGRPHDGQYKCHLLYAPTKAWYEIEDLRVVPTLPQMVALSESYVQLYQRQDVHPDGTVLGNLASKDDFDVTMFPESATENM